MNVCSSNADNAVKCDRNELSMVDACMAMQKYAHKCFEARRAGTACGAGQHTL